MIETTDVFGDRAIKQRYILRQVADKPAQILVAPLIECGSIEPHKPALWRPNSNQRF